MKSTKLIFRLLFCTFMLNVFFMNAQQNNTECATAEPTSTDPSGVYSYSTDVNFFYDCEIVVFNIKFWGINHPNGIDYFPNRANDVLQGVANLNILYNKFGIYFKYRGYEAIDSPALPGDPDGYFVLQNPGQYSSMLNWAAANGHKDENAFNVYAFGWATGFGGIAHYRALTCGVSSANLLTPILSHELGHNLNLIHTNSAAENATRNPSDPCFNATYAGDGVVDTNANIGFDPSNTNSNCEYTGNETDNCSFGNTAYFITHEDIINAMGKRVNIPCGGHHYFSTGQGIRMRETIAMPAGYYDAALTDVASLYEPYAGEYFYSSTQGIPANYVPLFQPGFDYKFVECSCDCPLPSDYNDTSFYYNNNVVLSISKYETDFSIITHPNHTAIHIDLISPCIANGQLTRRCYDNYNSKPAWGSVTKFNDGVLNANITVTPKDSLGINSPTLVDELNSGLYKIEKNYLDGATDQDIIFKEN